MVNREQAMEIARIILQQMGGHLKAMVGASDILALNGEHYPTGGLQFTFKGNRKMNKCLIILDASDTYTVQFWNCRFNKRTFDATMDKVAEFGGVYNDMLIGLFEETTGLYLTL